MIMEQAIGAAADKVLQALVAGLEIEFGRDAGKALAQRFLEAEESDFVWDARIAERWLGTYESTGEDAIELDRVATVGKLDGHWFAAVQIVDGDGCAHGLISRQEFAGSVEAHAVFTALH